MPKPEVFFEGEFEDTFTIPAGEVCPFEVEGMETSRVQEKGYFNKDGSLNRVHVKVRGTTYLTGPGGTAWDRWAWNGVFDAEALTFTQNGNVFNVHSGSGGVLLNDSGKIVFDDVTGEVLRINGPHEAWFEEFDALCEALG